MSFVDDAIKTKSPHYYSDKVDVGDFLGTLKKFVEVGNELDRIKKKLFYDKGEDQLPTSTNSLS